MSGTRHLVCAGQAAHRQRDMRVRVWVPCPLAERRLIPASPNAGFAGDGLLRAAATGAEWGALHFVSCTSLRKCFT